MFDFGGHSFHTPHQKVRDLVFNSLDMYEQRREAAVLRIWRVDTLSIPEELFACSPTSRWYLSARRASKPLQTANPSISRRLSSKRFGARHCSALHVALQPQAMGQGPEAARRGLDRRTRCCAGGRKGAIRNQRGSRSPLQADTMVAYPIKGGYGEIYKALSRQVGDVRLNESVELIDIRRKVAITESWQLVWVGVSCLYAADPDAAWI